MSCPKIIGVYKITNTIDGKYYIGSSVDIKARWNRHRRDLNKGLHNNRHIQNAWIKYGETRFCFEILLECDKNIVLDEEQHILNQSFMTEGNNIYNVARNCKAPMKGVSSPMKGRTHSLITRAKMTESHLEKQSPNRGNRLSIEVREKMSEDRKGEKHPMWGRKIKESTLRKISESCQGRESPMKGKKHSKETLAKISLANKGKIVSLDTRKKLSIAGLGRIHSMETRIKLSIAQPNKLPVFQMDKCGKIISIYDAIGIASRDTAIDASAIVKACKGTYKTAGGFRWMYVIGYDNKFNKQQASSPSGAFFVLKNVADKEMSSINQGTTAEVQDCEVINHWDSPMLSKTCLFQKRPNDKCSMPNSLMEAIRSSVSSGKTSTLQMLSKTAST